MDLTPNGATDVLTSGAHNPQPYPGAVDYETKLEMIEETSLFNGVFAITGTSRNGEVVLIEKDTAMEEDATPMTSTRAPKRKRTKDNEGTVIQRRRKYVKPFEDVQDAPERDTKPEEVETPVKMLKTRSKKDKQSSVAGQVKWTVVPSASSKVRGRPKKDLCSGGDLKPRIWASSRDDLVSILPELSAQKCVSGISWVLSDAPMVLLEEKSSMSVSINQNGHSGSIELTMVRDFVCASADLRKPEPERPVGSDEFVSAEKCDYCSEVREEPQEDVSAPIIEETHIIHSSLSFINSRLSTKTVPLEKANALLSQASSILEISPTTRRALSRHRDRDRPFSGTGLTGVFARCPCSRTRFTPGCLRCNYMNVDLDVSTWPEAASPPDPRFQATHYIPTFPPERVLIVGKCDLRSLEEVGQGVKLRDVMRSDPNGPMSTLPGAPVSEVPQQGTAAQGRSAAMVDENLNIPYVLPEEIQVLLDAHVQGTPLIVVVSRPYFQEKWAIPLSQEYAYVYLGFFKISCVLEKHIAPAGDSKEVQEDKSPSDPVIGRVEWHFRLEWTPGGEQHLVAPETFESLSKPWWVPKPLRANRLGMAVDLGCVSSCDSTLRYRRARRIHPNYAQRQRPVDELHYSLLPMQLLSPLGSVVPDESFPRGWFCEDCGKLGFQELLRHRRCSSALCKDKPLAEGYAHELRRLRDPQQTLPMSLPYNVYEKRLWHAKVAMWQDGMRTVTYSGASEGGDVVLKHIFTCNVASLQAQASTLLREMQQNVPLRRKKADISTPYFTYTVAARAKGADSDAVVWKDAPAVVHTAKELLLSRASGYGEKNRKDLSVKQMTILAWVTSGTRKGIELLKATQHPVLLMSLGCDVDITIKRKSKPVQIQLKVETPNPDSLLPMEGIECPPSTGSSLTEVDVVEVVQEGSNSGGVDAPVMPPDGTTGNPVPVTKPAPIEKPPTEHVVVHLVHGDILMLSGDDFSYSLKRSGTSILLIGS